MRNIVLGASLLLAACGGGGEQAAPPPTPTPTPPPVQSAIPGYDLPGTIAALKQHTPMPLFPIGPPSYVNAPLDAQGIILDRRTNRPNPTVVARYAIERFHIWRGEEASTAEPYRTSGITQTDWLVANIDCKKNVGLWRHDFPASYGVEPGWGSGFTNAHGVVALMMWSRSIADPQRYLDPAFCAINAFDVDVLEDGLRTSVGAGYWFEEYPTPARPGVLNGHIFALASLHYACTYGKIAKACGLFDKGVEGLRHRLPEYDAGIISRYSLADGNYASPGYNQLQAQLLEWLQTVRPDPVFQKYMNIFFDYMPEQFDMFTSSAPSPANGPAHLTDGFLWSGYWSTYNLPATVHFDMGKSQAVKAIAISFVGDNVAPFKYSILADDGSEGPYVDAPAPTVPARYVLDGIHRSTVGVYNLGITARRIRIRFDKPTINTVVALREINVIH